MRSLYLVYDKANHILQIQGNNIDLAPDSDATDFILTSSFNSWIG